MQQSKRKILFRNFMSNSLAILTGIVLSLVAMLIVASVCLTFLKIQSHKKYQSWLEHLKEKHESEFNESEDEE